MPAWVPPLPLPARGTIFRRATGPTLPPGRRPRCHGQPTTSTLSPPAKPAAPTPLSTDEDAAALSAARASFHLSRDAVSSAATSDLFTFCAVKGITLPSNPWDRPALLSAALHYLSDERTARLRTGPTWEKMPERERIVVCHAVANAEGDVTYTDPRTGYTVFTFFGHVKRGNCCGVKDGDAEGTWERTHRCRHCPYTDDGRLVAKRVIALRDRVAVVERARVYAQSLWSGEMALADATEGGVETREQAEFVTRESTAKESVPRVRGPVGGMAKERGEHLRRLVRIEQRKTAEESQCAACCDEQLVTCTRCSGWTYLFSPELMECPQCSAKGFHPCMACTPFRPPSRSSFYS